MMPLEKPAHVSNPEANFQRHDDMVFRRLGLDMVLVPIRRGIGDFDSFYILNEVGGFLWERLATPHSLEDLSQALAHEFEVDLSEAKSDVQAFLDKLKTLGALK